MFFLNRIMQNRTRLFSAGARSLCLLALLALCQVVVAADSYAEWSYNKKFTINTTVDGAATTGNVYAFPLLVRLNPGNFTSAQFGQCKTGGADIRFAGKNGKHLFYQVERWNSTKDSAEIWVNVDTILGNNATQYITMYWGNAAAVDSSRAQKVFDTANGYESAVHFTPTTTDTFTDATYRAYNAVSQLTTVDTAGIIGRGRCNRDANSALYLQNAGYTFSHVKDSLFISVWLKTNRQSSDSMNVGSGVRHEGHITPMQIGSYGVQYAIWHPAISINLWGNRSTWNGYIADNNWHYFVFTYDSVAGSTFYLDGMILSQDAQHGYLSTTSTAPFRLGSAGGVDEWFPAIWDEVVLAKKVRGPDWIQLCFANQSADQAVVSPTAVINPGSYAKGPAGARAFKVRSAGQNMAVDFACAQSGNMVLKMFDLSGKEVRTLARGNFAAGPHHIELARAGLSRGIYLFELQSAQGTIVRSVRIF